MALKEKLLIFIEWVQHIWELHCSCIQLTQPCFFILFSICINIISIYLKCTPFFSWLLTVLCGDIRESVQYSCNGKYTFFVPIGMQWRKQMRIVIVHSTHWVWNFRWLLDAWVLRVLHFSSDGGECSKWPLESFQSPWSPTIGQLIALNYHVFALHTLKTIKADFPLVSLKKISCDL